MGTRSKVARHPARTLIERALAMRTPPLRDLAERFKIDASSLCRYRQGMSAEQVADAILGTAGGLSRDELLELCRREHDAIPASLATRRQRLEHISMVAMNASDWPAFLAADTRLHALDEFTHRLFSPVMDGLAAAKPTVTRIERVVLYQRADGSVSLQDDEEQLSQDVTVEPPDDAQPDPAFDPDLDPVNVVPLPTSLPIYGFQTGHRRKPP